MDDDALFHPALEECAKSRRISVRMRHGIVSGIGASGWPAGEGVDLASGLELSGRKELK